MSEPNREAELEAKLAELQRQNEALQQELAAKANPTAPGERGVAAQTVEGPVATGDHARQVQSDKYVERAEGTVIFAEKGATVVVGEALITMSAVERSSNLGRYLHHVISQNRYLQLQGIRSGGKLVHIELDHIYIRLRTTQERHFAAEEVWLQQEAKLAPGELHRGQAPEALPTTLTISVEQALAEHRRLVVLGDPGSGKTTLLRYLALLYARDQAEDTKLVEQALALPETGSLPILMPLRQIGAYLRTHHPGDDGTDGHALLIAFFFDALANQRLDLPSDFFDTWLNVGHAIILLDGLDEVANPELRRRVSRLVESFTRAYPDCRYVVTSRIVGYTGAARLGEDYITTTVRDFTLADVAQFLTQWHRLVAIGQMGAGPSAEVTAQQQTQRLLTAIQANPRIRELAINPLMLTVIAMVHRDRVKLPDRRAELYAEAVDVLLGKWDEARGLPEPSILPDNQPFDTGDRRLMLQNVALYMHEQQRKEIDTEELQLLLNSLFFEILRDERMTNQAVTRFLHVIEERTGLLVARGEGVYAFSHLTFQEYLAALAVVAQDDYIVYTLAHTAEPWWREVILLAAGYLSTQSRERTTRLIRAIVDKREEPVLYHNLVLAAECLRDVGDNRVEGNLAQAVQQQLRKELETPVPKGRLGTVRVLWERGMTAKALAERRMAAALALAQIGGTRYWNTPHGEPDWVSLPAGEFWMGEGKALRYIYLDSFLIARTPITNAQYHLFTQASSHEPPRHWEGGQPPKNLESHPVNDVTWNDAQAYCAWLSQVTDKAITLPSEAQWERAARGNQDQREYPWGDEFEATRCNCKELGLDQTTPVGIFQAGGSPDGCLDMAGNVWEWTRSIYKDYPYDPNDGRENLEGGDDLRHVLRGGAFYMSADAVGCGFRYWFYPNLRYVGIGFRVVASPSTSGL